MKNQTAKIEEILKKAAKDSAFREKLIDNPETTLTNEGVALPKGVSVKILENSPGTVHLVLPPFQIDHSVSDEDLENLAGGYAARGF